MQKTVGSNVTSRFVFDRFGHLLAEANGSGVVQKEYIWLDDVPVAVVDESGAAPVLYYIHTDQLGTPQKITNGSAIVLWDGVFDPFGNPQFVSGAGVWNTSTWNNFTWGVDLSLTNLRFPGQYLDAETALNQNWFRDYDPTIGRYIQSDPIGLTAGPNTYAYVGANPLSLSDPAGEQATLAWCAAGPWSCAAGALAAGAAIWMSTPAGQQAAKKAANAVEKLCYDEPDDFCYRRWGQESERCWQWKNLGRRWVEACRARAADRLRLCIRNGGRPSPDEPPEWSPFRDYFR